METQVMSGLVDYVVVDDESRALITFNFPHLDEETQITIVLDRAREGSDVYNLHSHEPTLILSANVREVFVMNVWRGSEMVANSIYLVDTSADEGVLRQICSCGLDLVQNSRLSCEWDSPPFPLD